MKLARQMPALLLLIVDQLGSERGFSRVVSSRFAANLLNTSLMR